MQGEGFRIWGLYISEGVVACRQRGGSHVRASVRAETRAPRRTFFFAVKKYVCIRQWPVKKLKKMSVRILLAYTCITYLRKKNMYVKPVVCGHICSSMRVVCDHLCSSMRVRRQDAQRLRCQYLYFCTSKASKLGTG